MQGETLTQKFQKHWLHEHVCRNCAGRALILDGNAKVRTRLCANSDDGAWICRPLRAHCLTGCQRPPIPGKKFCSLHLQDAEPFFGSDLRVRTLLSMLCTGESCLKEAPGTGACPACCALPALCKRAKRACKFAFVHAAAAYPVRLLRVQLTTLLLPNCCGTNFQFAQQRCSRAVSCHARCPVEGKSVT